MSTVLSAAALRAQIPCRPDMVLLDKVMLESETRAVGQKCITMNEATFLGHFPGHPIFPGVLQVEAICQLAEVLLRKKLDPELKGDFYLKNVRKVKFRRPNNPGDRMIFEPGSTATAPISPPRSKTAAASPATPREPSRSVPKSPKPPRSCLSANTTRASTA